MRSTHRKLLAAAVIILLGAGAAVYEDGIATRQRAQSAKLHVENETLATQLRQLCEGNARASTALADIREELASLESKAEEAAPAASAEIEMRVWLSRLQSMRNILSRYPELGIPELCFLSNRDWLHAAKDARFDTEEHMRQSLAALRTIGKELFLMRLSSALRRYLAITNGELPPSVLALAPYFEENIDLAIFQNYEMTATGNISKISDLSRTVTIREKTPVDETYDRRHVITGLAMTTKVKWEQ